MDYQEYVNLGQQHIQEGNWEEAIDKFKNAFILKPRSEEALRGFMLASYEAGKFDEAFEEYGIHVRWLSEGEECPEEATTTLYHSLQNRFHDAFNAIMKKGMQFWHHGAFETALKEFSRALDMQPHHPSVMYYFMSTLLQLERYDEGTKIFEDFAQHLQDAKGKPPSSDLTELYLQMKVKEKGLKSK